MFKIKWIGQNGYIIYDGKTAICMDPYLSDVVNRVANRPRMVEAPLKPEELKCEAVICTHNHLDHVDVDAIPDMCKTMLFLSPSDAESTLRECGVTKYQSFDEGDSVTIGEFELKAVFADHTVPSVGVVIKYSGITMYFTGDTEYHEKLTNVDCDILFVCINGKLGNMNVEDAIKLTKEIHPKVGVPTHYGMFESNTENPKNYTSKLDCGFEMEYNREYAISEVLGDV